LDAAIEYLKIIYKEITVHEKDSHDYFWMIMTRNIQNQTVKIDMKKYIRGCIEEFIEEEPDERMRPVHTPASNYLFRVRDVEKISRRRVGLFHSVVAKLLFVAKRARHNLLLTVLF
jgi:hypothetical protein